MNFIWRYKIIAIIFTALLIRLFLTYVNLSNPSYSIQQDRYADYAKAIKEGTLTTSFPDADRRLLPGYPLLILLFTNIIPSPIYSGLLISILSSLLVILLMWKLSHNIIPVLLIAFFPPIWVEQGTEVANETVFILFCLLSLFMYFRKKYFIAGLLAGFAFDIRIVGISFLAALLIPLINKKSWQGIINLFVGFCFFVAMLLLFNLIFFGNSDLFQQFTHSNRHGGIRFGVIQLAQDFYRTIDWGQYKIFISGLFYLSTNLLALIILFLHKSKSLLHVIFFYWLLFSLLFILTFSPVTLLDDFARYTIAAVPAYILAGTIALRFFWRKIN